MKEIKKNFLYHDKKENKIKLYKSPPVISELNFELNPIKPNKKICLTDTRGIISHTKKHENHSNVEPSKNICVFLEEIIIPKLQLSITFPCGEKVDFFNKIEIDNEIFFFSSLERNKPEVLKFFANFLIQMQKKIEITLDEFSLKQEVFTEEIISKITKDCKINPLTVFGFTMKEAVLSTLLSYNNKIKVESFDHHNSRLSTY